MAAAYGIEKLGFLTLTFADHVLDPKEAQRRFNSLATHVLKDRYREWIRVFERQKSGRIHYHLLVALDDDVRSGCDFDAFGKGDYRTASPALRREWSFWRMTAKKYRFGRTELLPIKSTVEAAAAYVGKYISKHLAVRKELDKGVRLVAYSRGAQRSTTRFAWAGKSSREWRKGVQKFAELVAKRYRVSLDEVRSKGLKEFKGARWAWDYQDLIWALAASNGADYECKGDSSVVDKTDDGAFAATFDELRRLWERDTAEC